MGNRFLHDRFARFFQQHSEKRRFLRLNEGGYAPRKMRPYGMESKKFSSPSIRKQLSRQEARSVKKAARRKGNFSEDR